jgi:hypothetical protein
VLAGRKRCIQSLRQAITGRLVVFRELKLRGFSVDALANSSVMKGDLMKSRKLVLSILALAIISFGAAKTAYAISLPDSLRSSFSNSELALGLKKVYYYNNRYHRRYHRRSSRRYHRYY